jgi:hypothetical protein
VGECGAGVTEQVSGGDSVADRVGDEGSVVVAAVGQPGRGGFGLGEQVICPFAVVGWAAA